VDDFKALYPQFWERYPALYIPDPGAEPDGIVPSTPDPLPEEPEEPVEDLGKLPEEPEEESSEEQPEGLAATSMSLPPEVILTPYVPIEVLEMYVEFAHACVNIARYRSAWKLCMGLFIAHFLTLYMQTFVDPENASPQAVVAAGQTKGLMSSKSVDQVSASYDFSHVMQDLDGWAAWKLTAFGVQFATLAKAYGMGGMRVT